MLDKHKYCMEKMSVYQILSKEEFNIFLPEIQRQFVWDQNAIIELMESIILDYPIGCFIFWKVDKKTINEEKPNLYEFSYDYDPRVDQKVVNYSILNNKPNYIVLDGQQRITSLFIAFKGSYIYKRKYKKRNNDSSYIDTFLYFNLNYSENDEDQKMFCFKENDEEGFYKIKNIIDFDSEKLLEKDLKNKKLNNKSIEYLVKLYKRIKDEENPIIQFFCITDKSQDKALDIFVKVNSSGIHLTKTDLLFSKLISSNAWKGKNSRKLIERKIKDVNSRNTFNFDKSYFIRLCIYLVGGDIAFKISSLNNNIVNKIIDNWNNICDSFSKMAEVLESIGISDEFITSYNSTIPIAYFIYKGGKIDTSSTDDLKEVKKYLAISMSKNLFGVASNQILSSTRNSINAIKNIKKEKFKTSIFKDIKLVGENRDFSVDKKMINEWFDKYKKGGQTFIILALLYNEVNLSNRFFHQDHCHPYAKFRRRVYRQFHIKDGLKNYEQWNEMRDKLPNLELLLEKENKEKSKTFLIDWHKRHKYDIKFADGLSLEFKDFELFYKERKKRMIRELYKLFDL